MGTGGAADGELKRPLRAVKLWWNVFYPYRRLCLRRWCWRIQVYDYRCVHHHGMEQ